MFKIAIYCVCINILVNENYTVEACVFMVYSGVARGRSTPGGTFRGAAKFHLHFKIWKGRKYFERKKFFVGKKYS